MVSPDLTIRAHKKGRWISPHPVKVRNFSSGIQQNSKTQIQFIHEILHHVGLLVKIDSQYHGIGRVFVGVILEQWHLLFAGLAPGGPEIYDHQLCRAVDREKPPPL